MHPRSRFTIALLLSLLVHALLLSLQFGIRGLGLPGLRLPWEERRALVPALTVRIVGANKAAAASAPSVPSANTGPAHPPVMEKPRVTTPSAPSAIAAAPRTDVAMSRRAGKPSNRAPHEAPRTAAATVKQKHMVAAVPPHPHYRKPSPAKPRPRIIATKQVTPDAFAVPIAPTDEAKMREWATEVADREAPPADEALAKVREEEQIEQARKIEAQKLEQENARQQALALEAQRQAEQLAQQQAAQEREEREDQNRRREQQLEENRLAEENARQQALALEARQRAEQLAQQQAAQRLEEENLQRAREIEEGRRAEAAARRQALELEARRQAEQIAAQQQAARQLEEENLRRMQQIEASRLEEENARRQALALEAQRQAEQLERQQAAQQLEEERARQQALELEKQRQAEQMARQQEENARRQAEELEARRQSEQAAVQEAARKREEENIEHARQLAAQRQAEENARRDAAELEARKQGEEAAAQQAAALAAQREAGELAAAGNARGPSLGQDADAAGTQGLVHVPGSESVATDSSGASGASGASGTQSEGDTPADADDGPFLLSDSDLAAVKVAQVRKVDATRLDADAAKELASAQDSRRRTIFGGADDDIVLKMYIDSWRQAIERSGNADHAQAVQGDADVTVVIRSDGNIESITVNRSDGRQGMDELVRRVAQSSAQHGAFPPDLVRRYDVIEIRRIWHFDDRLTILEAGQ